MTTVVFMGTPAFAVPSLRTLLQQYTVVGVVTQPDRPAGRGQQLIESPVKQLARQANVPVIQPQKLREPEAMAQLQTWAPDVIVVAAFGQILKPAVLDLPKHGCINVHASLLPRHRGAAPVAAAILAGDAEAGITIMKMDVGLDTGPMLSTRATPIQPDDTTVTLAERLSEIGAQLLAFTLPLYITGRLTPEAQPDAGATYAPQLKKEDGHLDFTRPAVELERRIRAFAPWPGTFAMWNGQPFKIISAALTELTGAPGLVQQTPAGIAVTCGAGALLLQRVQAPNKKPMQASDFVRGAQSFLGAQLT